MSAQSLQLSNQIRLKVLEMVYKAQSSHVGGALSMADILAVLYTGTLRIDNHDPKDPKRDRFILSKGHACSGLYAVLGLTGFFELSLLDSFAQNGSILLSHTTHKVPGVELSTGSLGHGLPIATGIALAGKRRGNKFRVYCLVSDGELDEGSNWESILFAPHHHLDNLTLIVDYNKIQSLGTVDEVLPLEPLDRKFESFGWNVISINGHDHTQILKAFDEAKLKKEIPTVILAHTIKGKGVDFMEDKLLWHYRSPTEQEFQTAIKQIQ